MTYILGQSITLQSSTSSEEPPRQSSPGCASTPVTRSWHLRYFLLFPSPHVMLHLPHGPQEVHIGSYVGNFYHQIRCVRLRTKTEISLIDRLGILTPNHFNNQCLPISVRNDFNEHAHVQTSARTVNQGRNAKSGCDTCEQ